MEIKNCFTCSKNESCVDYDKCNYASHWKPAVEQINKVCNTCKNFNYLKIKCNKFIYSQSTCVNKNYAEWESKK